jgi:uncharacterized UBP type Zn finger protein
MSDINANQTVSAEAEVKPEDQKKAEPEGESISGYVKAESVEQLLGMGFSKAASEKALFLNKNILEAAVDWIYEHQNDPDFNEEMRIVGRTAEEYFSLLY